MSCSVRRKRSKPTSTSARLPHPIDGYLLDGVPAKREAIAAVLADPVPAERAQPFYRALGMLDPARVPDETLMALRLALAGRPADDDAIRAMRGWVAAARTGDAAARAAYLAAVGTVSEP